MVTIWKLAENVPSIYEGPMEYENVRQTFKSENHSQLFHFQEIHFISMVIFAQLSQVIRKRLP